MVNVEASFTNIPTPAVVQLGQKFNINVMFEGAEEQSTTVVVQILDEVTGEVVGSTELPIAITTKLAVNIRDRDGRSLTFSKSSTNPNLFITNYDLPVPPETE